MFIEISLFVHIFLSLSYVILLLWQKIFKIHKLWILRIKNDKIS